MGEVESALCGAGLAGGNEADDFTILAFTDGHPQDDRHGTGHADDRPTILLVTVVEIELLQAMGIEHRLCGEGELDAMLAMVERVLGLVPLEPHRRSPYVNGVWCKRESW
jgi:hypothetical protein